MVDSHTSTGNLYHIITPWPGPEAPGARQRGQRCHSALGFQVEEDVGKAQSETATSHMGIPSMGMVQGGFHGGFHSHEGTPSFQPFYGRICPYQPAILGHPDLWKPAIWIDD